jgi:hypothetical protein
MTLRDFHRARTFKLLQVDRSMLDCLRRGITTLRDVWCKDLRWNRALRERIARGEILGPRIQQAVLVTPQGGAFAPELGWYDRALQRVVGISGLDYANPASGVLTFPPQASVEQVRAAVDRAIDERGAECIKIYEQREKMISFTPGAQMLTEPQLGAIADRARARGLQTTMHHVSVESFGRGRRAGVSSLGHHPSDRPLPEAEAVAYAEEGGMVEPTVSLAYALAYPLRGSPLRHHPRMARVAAARPARLTETLPEFWLPELAEFARRGIERAERSQTKSLGIVELGTALRYYTPVVGHGLDNVKRLYRAKVPFGLGNDGGAAPPLLPAMQGLEIFALHQILAEDGTGAGTSPGLDPAEALRMATLHAARAMGLLDRLGSIEAGKLADLVVVPGDPLSDPAWLGSVADAVFFEGRLVIDACGLRASQPDSPRSPPGAPGSTGGPGPRR